MRATVTLRVMALRLLAATTNQGKLRDFRVAAEAFQVEIEPLGISFAEDSLNLR